MRTLKLDYETLKKLACKLHDAGYQRHDLSQYVRFTRGHGDSSYVMNTLSIARSKKGTLGAEIFHEMFGQPNGSAPDKKEMSYDSWFFNGYSVD